jgi:hypothetical protein
MTGPPPEGVPYIDPTENVIALVSAAMRRQDDLRDLVATHAREMAQLREHYASELRQAETARINAIRTTDVGAVAAAAAVATTQANTLAAQVATSAETLRTQVAAAATAATVALAAALEPIQKDIADLRRAQYEAQGQKTQVIETRDVRGESRLNVNLLLSVVLGAVAVITLVLYITKK